MKKKLWSRLFLLGILLAAVLCGCGARQDTPDPGRSLVRVWGPVLQAEDETMILDNRSDSASLGALALAIDPDSTKILDAQNGFPVELSELEEDEAVLAYVPNPAALSEPPAVNAEAILCHLPADLRVPDYLRVEALEQQSGGSYLLTSESGTEYLIPADCEIIPYLTKNRVVLADLKKGSVCLLWSDEKRAAQKILLFAD